jgi:hypothetical protein
VKSRKNTNTPSTAGSKVRRGRTARRSQFFVLSLDGGSEAIEGLPNLGVYAAYNRLPVPGDARLFVAHGPEELLERLEQFQSSGMLPNPPRVWVETAYSESDLTDLEYEGLVRSVLAGINRIKKLGDKATLRRVRSALESRGGKRGPKVIPENNAWVIDLLKELAAGTPLKQARLPKPWKPSSASAKLSRFCWNFYQLCMLYRAPSQKEWQSEHVADVIRKQFGFQFPSDLGAAQEAFLRGEAQLTAEEREYKPGLFRYDFQL